MNWRTVVKEVASQHRLSDPATAVRLHNALHRASLPVGSTMDDLDEAMGRLASMTLDDAGLRRLSNVHDPAAFIATLIRDARVGRLRRVRLFSVFAASADSGDGDHGIDRRSDSPVAAAIAREEISRAFRAIESLRPRQSKVASILAFEGSNAVKRVVESFFDALPPANAVRAAYALIFRTRRRLRSVLGSVAPTERTDPRAERGMSTDRKTQPDKEQGESK
jgi:hypothetical protein